MMRPRTGAHVCQQCELPVRAARFVVDKEAPGKTAANSPHAVETRKLPNELRYDVREESNHHREERRPPPKHENYETNSGATFVKRVTTAETSTHAVENMKTAERTPATFVKE